MWFLVYISLTGPPAELEPVAVFTHQPNCELVAMKRNKTEEMLKRQDWGAFECLHITDVALRRGR